MVSSTHDNDQIMVSKEFSHAFSSSENTYGLSKSDTAESSSAKKYALSKAREDKEAKEDNVKNKGVVDALILDNNNELFHIEEEVNICDTCGDLGWERLLVICGECKVGAQHTYCMIEEVDKVLDKWSCYDCTKDQDKMRERQGNEETNFRKRKAESFIDDFEVAEKKRPSGLLNTQYNCKIPDLNLNMSPNTELNEDANTYLKEESGIDLNKDPNTDLIENPDIDINEYLDIDLNHDPNTNMNMDPNMGMSLGRASYFELGSSSNI